MSTNFRDIAASWKKTVPRYTSYPTAPHFKKNDGNMATDISKIQSVCPDETASLYVHIPFCHKMCWYCGCHTKVTKQYDPVRSYIDLLCTEIELSRQDLPSDIKVSHIHFGGGSPGLLEAEDFTTIMQALGRRFDILPTAEIAIELDPRNITNARVESYASNGVNRVSLGVQDFDDRVLEAVNRQQPFELSYDGIALLRQFGINKINTDIMYGLPYQSLESMSRTLERLMLIDPDRIAFFGYAHVPWMKKHMRLIKEAVLPDQAARFDIFTQGTAQLQNSGYAAIGIDHFVKRQDAMFKALSEKSLRRNFQGYTTDQATALIGFGVSSISRYKQGYTQNTPDMPVYKKAIEEENLPISKIYSLSEEDKIRSAIIEEIMCYLSLDLAEITERFDKPADYFDQDINRLKEYEAMGFVQFTGERSFVIPEEARVFVRIIASVFDVYLKQSAVKNASAAPVRRHAQAI